MEQTILTSAVFQMSLLLFVALAGYLIAYWINQSAVVGIILVGTLVGPSFLGLITHTEFVSSLAQLGAIVLLFTIGLEFELKQIANTKYLVIALFGVIVPWLCGFFLAKLFTFDFKASVFIGTSLMATSIAITSNVLKEMGKVQTEAAKAIIGAAVIDDVLVLLALSASEGFVLGDLSLITVLIIAAKAIGFILIGVLLGKLAFAKIMIRLDKTRVAEKYPESIFIFTIMVAFLYAVVAELAGLSAIIGSFLAGVSFAGISLRRGQIFKDGAEHLRIIFASIFFISLGVLINIHEITLNLLLFLLVLTIVAILSKVIGCGGSAKLQGMNIKDSLIVGFGMAPRGEVTMVVALIGLNQMLIFQNTYSALILMSLLTTIITPIILRSLLFKEGRKKSGRTGKKIKQ
jgi:Kef-type K+ transport system membrane component KefB